ncbi:hypothetical protein 1 [Beihai picorna-like virus 19]|uniref:hypothetical protein 1 n=1 Tax=Beihai picorna-like virus 19 TaxID=1922561 RepID=UPI00090ABCD4|nr:hypothetical protein 1 [Beihai picorna-like virus 19]APG76785.1 hypothetical protein 1 [Beihai picorna-like virus 19]
MVTFYTHRRIFKFAEARENATPYEPRGRKRRNETFHTTRPVRTPTQFANMFAPPVISGVLKPGVRFATSGEGPMNFTTGPQVNLKPAPVISRSCNQDSKLPGHERLHLHCTRMWLEPVVKAMITQELSQNALDSVPAPATQLVNSLGELFAGKLPLTPDAELNGQVLRDNDSLKAEGHTFMSAFRYCMENWQKARDSPLRRHTTNLLQVAISMGFAPSHWSELTLGSINVYNFAVSNKFKDAGDCMDAVVMAVNYFVEAAVESWEVGNLLPFLRDRSLNSRLDKLYADIQEQMQWIEDGSFMKRSLNWSTLYSNIATCKQAFMAQENLVSPTSFEKRYFSERVKCLQGWYMKVIMMKNNGENIPQTPAVIFYGKPGCGKSKIMKDTLKLRAAMCGIEFDPSTVANAVVDDAFDSTMWNHTLFYVMDDIANRPLDLDPSKGIIKLLQLSNNVPYTATKAELEHKGVVQPNLLLVTGSTNVRHLNIDLITQCPESIKRRFFLVDVVVKAQYANEMGGVNEELVNSLEDKGELPTVTYAGNSFQDIYWITINKASQGWKPAEYSSGLYAKKLTIGEYFVAIEMLLAKHDRSQERHMARIDTTKMPMKCPTCSFVDCKCVSVHEDKIFQGGQEVKPPPQTPSPKPEIPKRPPKRVFTPPQKNKAETPVAPKKAKRPIPEFMEQPPAPSLNTIATPPAVMHAPSDEVSGQFDDAESNDSSIPSEVLLSEEENQGLAAKLIGLPTSITEFINMTGDSIVKAVTQEVSSQYLGGYTTFAGLMWHLGLTETTIGTTTRMLVDHLAYNDQLQWWYYVPNEWWDTKLVRELAKKFPDKSAAVRMRRTMIAARVLLAAAVASAIAKRPRIAASAFAGYLGCGIQNRLARESMHDQLTKRRDSLSEIAQSAREKRTPRVKALLYMLAGTSGAYYVGSKLLAWYMKSKEKETVPAELEPLMPRNPPSTELESTNSHAVQKECVLSEENQAYMDCDEAEFRRRELIKDEWIEKFQAVKPIRNPNMTMEQFKSKVYKNISMIEEKSDTGEYFFRCCMFWYRSGVFTIPREDVPKVTVTWRISDTDTPGCASIHTISPECFTTFKGSNMVVGFLNYRSKTDLTPYIDINPSTYENNVYLSKMMIDGKMHHLEDPVIFGSMSTPEDHEFRVITWKRNSRTFKGQCGGVYISPDRVITGVHYAGMSADLTFARSGLLSAEDIQKALEQQFRMEGRLPMPNPQKEPRSILGRQVYTEVGMKEDGDIIDQVEWLKSQTDEEFQGAVMVGRVPTTAYFKSQVVETPIAKDVQKRFPEATYGPPKFGSSMYPKSALYAFNNSPGMPRSLLSWARKDYMVAFRTIPEYLRKDLRPLTMEENLNGIDGLRFVDPVKANTSAGAGMPGGKWKYMDEYTLPDGRRRRVLKPEVMAEYQKAKDELRAGRSVGFLFKGTPKDEATHTSKDKVRIFTVGEFVAVLIVREYFVMVNRVIQFMTGRSECAVGVNCDSDDWESIWSHLEKFSRWFDLDYSKYDLRMDAETISQSYGILCEIALAGKYSADDLFIMNMLIGDIIWPLVAYAKWVYQLNGSWVSGIPLTVIINSINNSLLMRCAYKATYPTAAIGSFRNNVHLLTYGDDVIAAVHWMSAGFNFLSVQKFLAAYGVKITPGDKAAAGTRFAAKPSLLVFLQRLSVRLRGLNYRVGKLKEASILKRLVAVNYNPELGTNVLTAMNIDSALWDYASHGKEVYEDRRQWLKDIAYARGIPQLCTRLDWSWEMVMRKKFRDFKL